MIFRVIVRAQNFWTIFAYTTVGPMKQSESAELDALLASKMASLAEFKREQEEVCILVNSAYLAARTMIVAVLKDGLSGELSSHRFMMWQTVLEYQVESFFLLVSRRLDEGLAVLRMTAELARDLVRIGDDHRLLNTWLNRASDKTERKIYRTEFRFSDTDQVEAHVHRLYDLASVFGIHGHSTTSVSMQPERASPESRRK